MLVQGVHSSHYAPSVAALYLPQTVYSTITSHTQYAIKFLRPKCIGTLAYSSFAQDPATDLKEYVAPAEQQLLEKLYFAQLNIEDTWN
ncbi:hypothetical protein M404DRAFT_713858 [Pisolithus tinctorius Marx 270]|uniref:Uncharacterized protein n=1 Tax=Pisolithus tinctorius Marx 270 TaxID=870435 RepID=A0A0C3P4D9_PISTI|nr:hypothetical protein M404DRAFT_713858 [Pisolithus tinctorius Marx 270]